MMDLKDGFQRSMAWRRKYVCNKAPTAVLSQHSDGHGDVPRSPRIAFLVRTYDPTAETTKRITQWVSNLQASSNVDVFISIDRSITTATPSLLNALQSTGFNMSRIHEYTTGAMHEAYPGLNGKTRLAYQYVTASIDLFVQTLPHTYDYLWAIEDDVGYTGDISKLFEQYSGNTDDLISGAFCPVTNRYNDEPQTDLYKEWVPRNQRLLSENHLVRMSSRLLGRLNHWLKAGAIHVAEEMPPTVCKLEHMKCSMLAAMDLGMPYEFQSTHDLSIKSPAQWEEIQRGDAKLGKPRLYHPLKI